MRNLDHPSKGAVLKLPFLRHSIAKRFMRIGVVFVVIGAIAIFVPAWATLAGELLIAWMLSLWGAAGLWFAWEMRFAQEGRYAAVAFGVTFLLGLLFLLFPSVGVETLTVVMIVVFLMEGIVSILLRLRMSAGLHNWGWMIFSGVCSLIVGAIILADWPQTAMWTLGLLLGLNFLSTGASLLMLASAANDAA